MPSPFLFNLGTDLITPQQQGMASAATLAKLQEAIADRPFREKERRLTLEGLENTVALSKAQAEEYKANAQVRNAEREYALSKFQEEKMFKDINRGYKVLDVIKRLGPVVETQEDLNALNETLRPFKAEIPDIKTLKIKIEKATSAEDILKRKELELRNKLIEKQIVEAGKEPNLTPEQKYVVLHDKDPKLAKAFWDDYTSAKNSSKKLQDEQAIRTEASKQITDEANTLGTPLNIALNGKNRDEQVAIIKQAIDDRASAISISRGSVSVFPYNGGGEDTAKITADIAKKRDEILKANPGWAPIQVANELKRIFGVTGDTAGVSTPGAKQQAPTPQQAQPKSFPQTLEELGAETTTNNQQQQKGFSMAYPRGKYITPGGKMIDFEDFNKLVAEVTPKVAGVLNNLGKDYLAYAQWYWNKLGQIGQVPIDFLLWVAENQREAQRQTLPAYGGGK